MRSAQPAAGDWGDIAGAYKSDLASVRTEHAERREDVEIDSGGRRPQTDHQRAREFHFLQKRGASEGNAVAKRVIGDAPAAFRRLLGRRQLLRIEIGRAPA